MAKGSSGLKKRNWQTHDIVALANNTSDLQLLVNKISRHARNIGMLSGEHPSPTDVFIDQKKVEEVGAFKYLSSSISNNSDLDQELTWIGKAAAAFNQLGKIWSSKKFSERLKLRFQHHLHTALQLRNLATQDHPREKA